MTAITCERCGAEIRADDVNLSIGVAKCGACGGVFDLGHRTAAAQGSADRPPRPTVPLPERFEVSSGDGELLIRWRWFKPSQHIATLFFCIAWDSFLFFWYSMALFGSKKAPWLMIVFPIAHVAVGVSLTYATIAGFLNRTWVRATRAGISIRHTPLPWKGNRDIERAALRQLYTSERVSQSRRGTSTSSYELRAVMRDGSTATLLSLDTPEQALFLEQHLEKRLDIVDAPVAGELARGA